MENNTVNNAMPLDIADLPTATPIEKKHFTVFEGICAVLSLGLGFFFTHFAFANAGGIWGGVMWLLFGGLLAVFAVKKRIAIKPLHIMLFVVSAVFSLVPLFSANIAINTLAAFFVYGVLLYLCIALSGSEVLGRHFVGDMLNAVFARPFSCFVDCPRAAVSLIGRVRGGKNAFYIFLGLLMAVPLTIVVVFLLMSSDGMFESFMDGVWNGMPSFSPSVIGELIFGVPIGMFLCGALFASSARVSQHMDEAPTYRIFPLAAALSAVTPACVFYVAYLIVQMNYLSAAFGGTLPEPFTYSEFARRGFFELCVIAFINFGLIILMQTFAVRKDGDKRHVALKVYTVILSVLTLMLIACAMSKMFIYIGEYGMTQLRVYTSWFMALLAVMFIVMIAMQFLEFPVWKVIFAAFTVMFGVLCFSNVDGAIARYNVRAYQSGALEKVDMYSMGDLGVSAVPYVVEVEADFPSGAADFYGEVLRELERTSDVDYFSIPRCIARNILAERGYGNE
ncbi:MAG: DUF4173 domain-containing protein [Oscillospiraceae bacterium]|nr:DUF4173 domain-containing protein [Oscillospiraceae bacterium]